MIETLARQQKSAQDFVFRRFATEHNAEWQPRYQSMKRSISALSVSRARERQVKRFSPKCRHNHPIDVSYCTRFIQRYYLLSLSPLYSFHRRNISFEILSFVFLIFIFSPLCEAQTKLRREFYIFFPLEILVKCQLIKSSTPICTFLTYIPLVIFRTCRVFFLLFFFFLHVSRIYYIIDTQETRKSDSLICDPRTIVTRNYEQDEFVELLSRYNPLIVTDVTLNIVFFFKLNDEKFV